MKAVTAFVFILVCISTVFTQNDSLRSETILEIKKSDFRKSQIKRFNREGFDTDAYGWDDMYINTLLKKSSSQKTWSDVVGITGGCFIVLNAITNFFGHVFDSKGEFEPSYQMYLIGGAILRSFYWFHLKTEKS